MKQIHQFFLGIRGVSVLFLAFVLLCLSPRTALVAQNTEAPDIEQLKSELRSDDNVKRREASLALRNAGPAAASATPDLIRALDDRDDQVWFNSITALANIGPGAKAAVPTLIDRLRGDGRYSAQRSYRAAYALGKIGKPALPSLFKALEENDSRIRSGAAKALGWQESDANDTKQIVGKLILILSDDSSNVQNAAAQSLGAIGKPAVAPLVEMLQSSNPDAQWNAIYALGEIGSDAASAGLALLWLIESDTEAKIRREAIHAVARIDFNPKLLGPVFVSKLGTDDDATYDTLVNALLRLRPAESVVVPQLMKRLDVKSADIRQRASYVLGRIGEPARAAVPRLIALTKQAGNDEAKAVHIQTLANINHYSVSPLLNEFGKRKPGELTEEDWVLNCLKRIGPSAVGKLRGGLRNKNSMIRLGSILALRQIGPLAKDAAPQLRRLITDRDPQIRGESLLALHAVGADPAALLPPLKEALSDPTPAVRRAAARTLAELGEDAEPAAKQLTAALNDDEDAEVQLHTARALGAIGEAAEPAIPRLLQMLSTADGELQIGIVQALGNIGAAAASAAPQITELAATKDKQLKAAALASLASFQGAAKDSLPTIRAALDDSDVAIRANALLAFTRIETNSDALLPVVTEGLKDDEDNVRHIAAQATARLRLKSNDTILALFKMLDDEDDRGEAVAALRELRVRDLDLLKKSLGSDSPSVRAYAASALGGMGSEARDALPELRRGLRDKYDFVRRRAKDAIRRIER